LISDILAFSRINNEKDTFINYNLNVIMQEVLDELDRAVQDKQAVIRVTELPNIDVNPGLLRPLFSNLLSNAIKYSKKDVPPQINVWSEVTEITSSKGVAEKFCRIFFEDNGIGFDQQYAEQIFDMFRRLHVHSEFEGTGIGLTLCKKIVEKHNGFISVQSKVNKGSTFIISLPVQQLTAAQFNEKVPVARYVVNK
jgi:light-regulated signal transduction histidine kinase (bacteriophytochrome)